MEDNRDIADTAGTVGSVADMVAAVDSIIRSVRDAQRVIVEPLERNRELLVGIQRRFEQLTAFADAIDREKRLGEAGWIPHPLLPLNEVTADLLDDPEELDGFLLNHLRAHWGAVEARLLDDELFRIIGHEHRETVRQALAAHNAGLYRCVPRTMFGEIEMAAHGALDGVDSRLPNRHDQIHGFSRRRHASERDSANTLLLADMMFRLLAALRAEADESIGSS